MGAYAYTILQTFIIEDYYRMPDTGMPTQRPETGSWENLKST